MRLAMLVIATQSVDLGMPDFLFFVAAVPAHNLVATVRPRGDDCDWADDLTNRHRQPMHRSTSLG